MNSEVRLGRLVQCRCLHTCVPNGLEGYQWLLPRTKSKHMLYQQLQQRTSKSSNTSIEELQQQLDSFTIKQHSPRVIVKRKRQFKIPILLETELKRKVTLASQEQRSVMKEFFVKTSYN